MKVRIFHPYQKIWTPRTPDSGYDSLGTAPLVPVVLAPLIAEGIGQSIGLQYGLYEVNKLLRGSSEGAGYGITLIAGTYTPGKAPQMWTPASA